MYETSDSNIEYITDYIKHLCIAKNPTPTFGKMPGTRYSWQIQLHKAYYNLTFLEAVGSELCRLIDENITDEDRSKGFQLAGPITAAPIMLAIASKYKQLQSVHLNVFVVRDSRKWYGDNNMLEGIVLDQPVLLVNDLANSTNKYLIAEHAIKAEKDIEIFDFVAAIMNKTTDPKDKDCGKRIVSIVDKKSIFYE
jgi:orotate phosphoribosyltransferase